MPKNIKKVAIATFKRSRLEDSIAKSNDEFTLEELENEPLFSKGFPDLLKEILLIVSVNEKLGYFITLNELIYFDNNLVHKILIEDIIEYDLIKWPIKKVLDWASSEIDFTRIKIKTRRKNYTLWIESSSYAALLNVLTFLKIAKQ